MPKLKSHSGAKKRFRKTGSGRFKRHKAYSSHILTKKSRKRKRNLRMATLVDKTEQKKARRLLPYA